MTSSWLIPTYLVAGPALRSSFLSQIEVSWVFLQFCRGSSSKKERSKASFVGTAQELAGLSQARLKLDCVACNRKLEI